MLVYKNWLIGIVCILLLVQFNNKMMLVYGKIATQNNNSTATYTLPKAYTSTHYVCIANAILKNHWANIIGQTTSTITIHVADYGYNTASGFQYICY